MEKFDEVVPSQEPVYLKVVCVCVCVCVWKHPTVIPKLNFDPSLQLSVVERMVFAQILLRMKGRSLDLTEEVYTAGEALPYSLHIAEIVHQRKCFTR